MQPPHLLVMAKEPIAGRAKTRLSPNLSLEDSARVAAAALHDTLEAVRAARTAPRRVVAFDGDPDGWIGDDFACVAQCGATFNERLEAAWAYAGGPGLQIGMDTPQVTGPLLDECLGLVLHGASDEAWIGLAEDGGWWALGLHQPRPSMFDNVTMSGATTAEQQVAQLTRLGWRVRSLPTLRDLDEFDDLCALNASFPDLATSRLFRSLATADAR